ncbi:hypothetical protein T492DRAFT_1060128 [Pavlovales sp. CCMP2436]|nr:hypothetical protein T492DRAFT_1060128 [Pavlovales sp. CCMP2436]
MGSGPRGSPIHPGSSVVIVHAEQRALLLVSVVAQLDPALAAAAFRPHAECAGEQADDKREHHEQAERAAPEQRHKRERAKQRAQNGRRHPRAVHRGPDTRVSEEAVHRVDDRGRAEGTSLHRLPS